MLFASGGGSIEERCKIASEVVDAFTRIPATYLRAISSPLLHHLAGIGSILGSVFEEPISEVAYEQVRVVLLALAQLLEILDHGMQSTSSAQRLRDLVAQIDGYMKSQRDQVYAFTGGAIVSPVSSTETSQMRTEVNKPDAPRNLPIQLTNDFFEEWPWNTDFMQLAENWTSTNVNLAL